jgi:TonB family protein
MKNSIQKLVKATFVISLLLLLTSASPPDVTRIFLDENQKETTMDLAVVVRTIEIKNGQRIVSDHTVDGLPLHYGEYDATDTRLENGYFREYYAPGKLYAEGHYRHGKLAGKWIYYDREGRADTVDYDFERPECTLTENKRGALSQQQEGDLYRGLRDSFDTHFRLPPRQRDNDHFLVSFDFILGRDGKLHCIRFTQPLEEDLQAEALRLLQTYQHPNPPRREVRRPFIYAVGSGHWDEDVVYTIVEDLPHVYIPGYSSFGDFVAASLIYPEDAHARGASGTVFLNFVVEPDGSISDIRILKGVDASLDQEAIRAVATSPAWVPGRQRGIPVRVAFNIPVRFAL